MRFILLLWLGFGHADVAVFWSGQPHFDVGVGLVFFGGFHAADFDGSVVFVAPRYCCLVFALYGLLSIESPCFNRFLLLLACRCCCLFLALQCCCWFCIASG